MKKSSFLSMVFSALLAATLVVSCDTGGGGGGGGGGSSAPSSTDIKIIIGSDSSSSDILGDFGENESNNFYYKVYFTAGGNPYSDGGSKGETITFPNVPFGTYEFNLDIYSDKTEAAILIGTETVTKDIQQAQNTVEFNLKYSAYQNIYFVSDAASFVSALMGLKKDGNPIDKSRMKEDDESTWVRVYVNESFTLEGTGNALNSDTQHYVKVFMNGNTITTNYSGGYGLRLEDNITASFENGKIVTPWVQVDAPTASLSLDSVELTQKAGSECIFFKPSKGRTFVKNSTIRGGTSSQPNVSVDENGMLIVEDSTIESSEGEAISMSSGTVALSGTTVKNESPEVACVSVSGGTLSVTDGSKISAESYNAVNLSGGTLTVSDSIIEANDMHALHLEKMEISPAPTATLTNSNVTSGGDAIWVTAGTLNLEDTTVTTTGTEAEEYYGIYVSGNPDTLPIVTMNDGTVSAPNSSGSAVYLWGAEGNYDNCKFVLTGGGKLIGNERGLKMEGGTFVMLGGEIEATSTSPTAAAVGLTSCVFAMTDSYAGTLASGANSVNKINCDNMGENQICILMGGNSHANTVAVNSYGVIFAQVSDIRGVEKFVGYVQNPVLDGNVTFVAKKDFTIASMDMDIDFNLPAEFSYTTDESPYSYFDLDEDTTGYSWLPSTLVYGDNDILFWKAW